MPYPSKVKHYYPRVVERLLATELLPVFPAVLIVGPRGSGKSTSAARFADTVIDLSQPGPAQAAREDPDGILASRSGTMVIDEWQEVPEIIGAVKRAVDADWDGAVGRFILTGSARAAQVATTWPGTGRIIRVHMAGLTQSELNNNNLYNPVDAFFSGHNSAAAPSELTRLDYLERIVSGRFPAVIKLSGRGRARWFDAYTEQLVELDARQLAVGTTRAHKLRAVLTSCATRTAQELNKQATARDAGVTTTTADSHLDLLEGLSIIKRIPPWHDKRLYRLTRSPKVHIVDPGLAAHLLETDKVSLACDASMVGQLLETFVATELLPHLETAAQRTSLMHFRDRTGREVDLVLERSGRFVGLEVKSSTVARRRDAIHLTWLKAQLGERFSFGAVLYTGQIPFEIEDRIWALPLSALWSPPNSGA